MRSTSGQTGIATAGGPSVYFFNLEQPEQPRLFSDFSKILDTDESTYVDSLTNPMLRNRYLRSRAILRTLLFASAGYKPAANEFFGDRRSGPPLALNIPGSGKVFFSISHSGNLSAISLNPDGRIGIDVEFPRVIKRLRETAEYAFAEQEVSAVLSDDPGSQDSAFLRIWTRKEAVIKCCGGSVARDMNAFVVPQTTSLKNHNIRVNISGQSHSLLLSDLDSGGGLFCSVAWEGTVGMIKPRFLSDEQCRGISAGYLDGDYSTARSYIL